jgi:hypothetical protein
LSGLGSIDDAIGKLFKGDFSGAWDSAKAGVKGIVGVDAFKNAYESGKGLGDKFNEGWDKGVADFQADKAKKEAKETGITPLGIVGGSSLKATEQLKGNPVIKEVVDKNTGKGKKTKSGDGSGMGSGGGKSITMNLTVNNHISGVKNPDEVAEIVARKINDRINDTLAQAG